MVGRAYVQTQNAQIAFSAKERVGIRVIDPAGELLGSLALTRAAAVGDGAELGVVQDWTELRDSIDGTFAALPEGVAKRSEALGELTAGAAVLIVKAGDTSNLILDPELDSFYVMDALVTKAPGMLTGLADASDRAVLAEVDADNALDHRIDLALTRGAIMSATDAGVAGLETSYEKTADAHLEADLAGPAGEPADATATAAEA